MFVPHQENNYMQHLGTEMKTNLTPLPHVEWTCTYSSTSQFSVSVIVFGKQQRKQTQCPTFFK